MQIDDRLKKLYIKYYSIESWDKFIVDKEIPNDVKFLQKVTKLIGDAK